MRLNLDVVDAISYVRWQTMREIASVAGVSLTDAKRTVAALVKGGYVDTRGHSYRYENARGER